ncbi:MAG: LysR family transcriptional regulator [Myxococcales bacterium]|nr:LysR family transcriptional regulator [Myxococcales bacterium]
MTRRVDQSLPNVEVFCRAYECRSFTRAAVQLGMTPQAASRAIARLEATLGITLFRRTTRSLEPTAHGDRYYEKARRALEMLTEAERELSLERNKPTGRVRISAPPAYALHRALPAMGRFRARFPGIDAVVEVSSHNVNFVRDDVDFAIRLGAIKDGSLVRRTLGDFAVGVFASPGYLVRKSAPQSIEELDAHDAITFVMPATGRTLPWTLFAGPKREPVEWTPSRSLRIEGDVLGCVAAAVGGAGLVQIYDFVVEREVSRGDLVEVMTAFRGESRPFSAVFPKGVTLSRAARTLLEFLIEDARPHARPTAFNG